MKDIEKENLEKTLLRIFDPQRPKLPDPLPDYQYPLGTMPVRVMESLATMLWKARKTEFWGVSAYRIESLATHLQRARIEIWDNRSLNEVDIRNMITLLRQRHIMIECYKDFAEWYVPLHKHATTLNTFKELGT